MQNYLLLIIDIKSMFGYASKLAEKGFEIISKSLVETAKIYETAENGKSCYARTSRFSSYN